MVVRRPALAVLALTLVGACADATPPPRWPDAPPPTVAEPITGTVVEDQQGAGGESRSEDGPSDEPVGAPTPEPAAPSGGTTTPDQGVGEREKLEFIRP